MITSGILLPSGESNFFDYTQFKKEINKEYPSPSGFATQSGIYKTYPPSGNIQIPFISGVLNPSGLINRFSSASGNYVTVTNLGVFNSYIHYYGLNDDDMNGKSYQRIEIPYVSTFKVSLGFDPYPRKYQ